MNKCLNVIGILLVLLLFPYCGGRESQPSEGKDNNAHAALAEIDSLMWRRADSAFVLLQEFVVSPEAKELDTYDEHYCQVLISELLYKNYKQQSNRNDLLLAVDFFDSLTANTHGMSSQERNTFLDARAHYINGVGFYERGDVVQACSEYLKALEVMEGYFEEKVLTGKRAQFMANIYNRMGDLFSEQFMMESAITCYENALVYCKIEPTSPIGVSNILYRIGKQYDKKNEIENARLYYGRALENMTVTDNIVYRDIVASKALCDYKVEGVAEYALDELSTILMQANTENERLNRYLTIGSVYFFDGNYDSALFYLEPVFENQEAGLQDEAANYMYIINNKQGDRKQADSLMHFLASRKKSEGENKALVSKLEDLFKAYMNQKQKKEAEKAREKSIRKTIEIVVFFTTLFVLAILVLAKQKSKQLLRKQQEETDRVLEETEQEHEKELRLWQAEADKTLEETEKKHEKELERLGEAVAKHYDGFDHVLLSQCPNLKHGYLALCHLHLLGLSESEIAALKNVSYSAIRKQNESLQEKLGVDETISAYVLRVSEGLCATPNVEQEKQPDMDLQRTKEENPGHSEVTEQKSSLKSSLKSSQKILELISASPSITISEIAVRLGMTKRGVDKNIKRLKEQGVIRRVGPDKGGHWEVIESL